MWKAILAEVYGSSCYSNPMPPVICAAMLRVCLVGRKMISFSLVLHLFSLFSFVVVLFAVVYAFIDDEACLTV